MIDTTRYNYVQLGTSNEIWKLKISHIFLFYPKDHTKTKRKILICSLLDKWWPKYANFNYAKFSIFTFSLTFCVCVLACNLVQLRSFVIIFSAITNTRTLHDIGHICMLRIFRVRNVISWGARFFPNHYRKTKRKIIKRVFVLIIIKQF